MLYINAKGGFIMKSIKSLFIILAFTGVSLNSFAEARKDLSSSQYENLLKQDGLNKETIEQMKKVFYSYDANNQRIDRKGFVTKLQAQGVSNDLIRVGIQTFYAIRTDKSEILVNGKIALLTELTMKYESVEDANSMGLSLDEINADRAKLNNLFISKAKGAADEEANVKIRSAIKVIQKVVRSQERSQASAKNNKSGVN